VSVKEPLAPSEVVDASESSRADPWLVNQHSARKEAYITMEALKKFMSTMKDAIMQQVSEQVKTAVDTLRPTQPLPLFEYISATGYEPSYRNDPMVSHRHSKGNREVPQANRDRRSREDNRGRFIEANAHHSHCPSHRRPTKSTTASMPYATHSR